MADLDYSAPHYTNRDSNVNHIGDLTQNFNKVLVAKLYLVLYTVEVKSRVSHDPS